MFSLWPSSLSRSRLLRQNPSGTRCLSCEVQSLSNGSKINTLFRRSYLPGVTTDPSALWNRACWHDTASSHKNINTIWWWCSHTLFSQVQNLSTHMFRNKGALLHPSGLLSSFTCPFSDTLSNLCTFISSCLFEYTNYPPPSLQPHIPLYPQHGLASLDTSSNRLHPYSPGTYWAYVWFLFPSWLGWAPQLWGRKD